MVKGVKLVVVESPTKAKTLGRFLGQEYLIEATMGQVRDLPKSELGVDVKHDFKPQYVLVEKRMGTIEELKKLAKKARQIILATDPDREGEAIAYHVMKVIRSSEKLKAKSEKFSRIVFHEITRKAIEAALKHPGQVNLQLVRAQQARRVVDRLVGYELSPMLWRKIRRGLSAGRVQSVAVRLIVDREKEIAKFVAQEYWEISVTLTGEKRLQFVAELVAIEGKKPEKGEFLVTNKAQADKIVADLDTAEYRVAQVEKKEVVRQSPPPFKTSTLQQAAATRWGWSSKRTMRTAQQLYERGRITYHRTDSFNLAAEAIDKARAYINSTYGQVYVPDQPRLFKNRSKLAQEAHEAIRPTVVNPKSETRNLIEKDLQKLYELIWKRFVASQMAAARFDKAIIDVEAKSYLLRAEGIKMKFDGWLKVYGGKTEEQVLPELKVGEDLKKKEVKAEQRFTQPPPRYTEASLIKTLEKLGIGRPSTYAPTISTIQVRQYVEKKEQQFFPTPVGMTVTEFLLKYFPGILSYEFTASMEDDLDKIAQGKREWIPVVREFYEPFARDLKQVGKKAARMKVAVEKTGEKCPECGKGEVVIRVGRFGKFLSCSRFPECKYTANFVQKVAGAKCQKCGQGEVVIRRTKSGRQFYGCSRYPECDWATWRLAKKASLGAKGSSDTDR
ncbi:MAG: type I DNA topoisomerase [Candidatus Chisholmbacteria bacterium]|nr:type I DNA topoisomerase [Candidatus Chisholmbacteria bacterium]